MCRGVTSAWPGSELRFDWISISVSLEPLRGASGFPSLSWYSASAALDAPWPAKFQPFLQNFDHSLSWQQGPEHSGPGARAACYAGHGSLHTGVEASAAQNAPVTTTCLQCGSILPMGARACTFC